MREIQGKTELHLFLNEFLQPYSDCEFYSVGSGYLVDIASLPYQFQFACYPNIGWNVFLVSKSDDFVEDEKTNAIYEQFEYYIDQLNFQYYDLFPEEQSIVTERLETIKEYIEETKKQYPDTYEQIHYKEPGILQIHFASNISMTVGFSRIFKRWMFDIWNDQEIASITMVRDYLQKQVVKWNHELQLT